MRLATEDTLEELTILVIMKRKKIVE